jgi:hypothetical protein
VSYGLAVVASGHPWVLWVALPVAIMWAVLAPVFVGVAGGQALFAVTVVALFNLVNDQGTLTAIQRIEAVGLGMVVALVVAVALWPRGPRPLLAAAFADLYRLGARAASGSLQAYVGAPPVPGTAPDAAPGTAPGVAPSAGATLDDAEMLATEALIDVIDQGHLDLAPRQYAPLFSLVALVQLLNRLESGMWERLGLASRPVTGAVDGVELQVWPSHLAQRMDVIATAFDVAVHPHRRPPGWEHVPYDPQSSGAGDRSAGLAGGAPVDAATASLVAGWVVAWVHLIGARLRRAEQSTVVVAAALARPWWR